jgi:hypothetical protein
MYTSFNKNWHGTSSPISELTHEMQDYTVTWSSFGQLESSLDSWRLPRVTPTIYQTGPMMRVKDLIGGREP